jgi:hypothetical protein
MGAAYDVQDAQAAGAAEGTKQGAAMQAAAPPPKPPPQLSPQEQNMLSLVRQDGAEAMAAQLKIAETGKLGQGESLQAQTAAANSLIQLAAKVEQIAADKTSIQ